MLKIRSHGMFASDSFLTMALYKSIYLLIYLHNYINVASCSALASDHRCYQQSETVVSPQMLSIECDRRTCCLHSSSVVLTIGLPVVWRESRTMAHMAKFIRVCLATFSTIIRSFNISYDK